MSSKTNRSAVVTVLVAALVVFVSREAFSFVVTVLHSAAAVAGGAKPDTTGALRWFAGSMMPWALLFGVVVNILVGTWIARRHRRWAAQVFATAALIAAASVGEIFLMGGQIVQALAPAGAASNPAFVVGMMIGAAVAPFFMSLILLAIGAAIGGLFKAKRDALA